MDPRMLRELLERVRAGDVPVAEAMKDLESLPFRDLGFATVDHHRALRQGVPEVIFGEKKTAEQIALIAEEIAKRGHGVLVTRLDADKAAHLVARVPGFRYAEVARTAHLEAAAPSTRAHKGPVAVVTAGTSDLPVAEEAVETLLAVGLEPARYYDVGVAGIHRLLHRVEELRRAAAVIVAAGMEGALPSVVGGVVSAPIVAVPTSVGYGTALGGFTALFAMLTSCASGVVVVNIDSGFGAAMAVHRILHRSGDGA
ncbi:MAG TPA: nickel pincer cofactor biosynthesis protein LarB [Minicystis sp.]|nr:nickel pincer cofactor biosynthesis protein LarB [Minicystis sp.]